MRDPWGQGLRKCWPPTVEHSPFRYQEHPLSSRFQAGSKDLLIPFGICPVNQFVYNDWDVLFSFSLSVLSVMCSVCQLLLALLNMYIFFLRYIKMMKYYIILYYTNFGHISEKQHCYRNCPHRWINWNVTDTCDKFAVWRTFRDCTQLCTIHKEVLPSRSLFAGFCR